MTADRTIAIIIPGGIEEQNNIPSLVDLLRRLSESYRLHIYSFSQRVPHPALVIPQCIFTFPPEEYRTGTLRTLRFLLQQIRNDHRTEHFFAVHAFWALPQGLLAVAAGKILHLPSMVTLPGGDIVHLRRIDYGSLSNPLKRFLARWCIRSADRIVVLTEFQQHILDAERFAYRHISVIPYGVDVKRFAYLPHPPLAHPRFLSVGNLNRVKDPFTLIRTFFHLTERFDCTLTVVGNGEAGDEVKEYARGFGVLEKIQFKGRIPNDAIAPEYHSADLLLLTSLYEGQGVVNMEAFACGTPVMGTNVGLLNDVGSDGFKVEPGDAEGLAAKVAEMIRHPERLQEAQIKNRLYAEQHSAEWTCSQYKALYEEFAGCRLSIAAH